MSELDGPIAAGAGAAECFNGEPSTATIGVGVEGLEVGGVGPRDTHPTPAAAAVPGFPACASRRTWDAEPSGMSSRFFPFGGPNLRAKGALTGAALEVFLCWGVGCAAEADADG